MSGKEKNRYVHLLKHPDYDGERRVICDCTSKMLCDYVTPQDRERNLKNRVSRRKNFMMQAWYRKPEAGNYTLRYKGDCITMMKSKFGTAWGIIYKGKQQWEYPGASAPEKAGARPLLGGADSRLGVRISGFLSRRPAVPANGSFTISR